MIVLRAGQVCNFSSKCPYVSGMGHSCQGINPDRNIQFTCLYVKVKNQKPVFTEGLVRSSCNLTGCMNVITENN